MRYHIVIMPSLLVREVEASRVARLKRSAAKHGRSAEAEHRQILRAALAPGGGGDFEELAAELRRLTARRRQTPSERLLRAARRGR